MTSSTRKLIVVIPIISRTKDNQTMKFGQNITKYFLTRKLYYKENMAEKLVPDPFSKNEN